MLNVTQHELGNLPDGVLTNIRNEVVPVVVKNSFKRHLRKIIRPFYSIKIIYHNCIATIVRKAYCI